MTGDDGDDSYVVDNASDVVTEEISAGIDTVSTFLSYTLGANVEDLTLTGSVEINGVGNDLDNTILGNSAANRLFGNEGNDNIRGEDGDDSLVGGGGHNSLAGGLGNVISENAGEGTDVVVNTVNHTLAANVEHLFLTGSANLDGTGNAGANELNGNTGANILNGRAGIDTMSGGDGSDVYIVDNESDNVIEAASNGFDWVHSGVNHTLAAEVEALNLVGAALNGTGNNLDNILRGNAHDNLLTGLNGIDRLAGGPGSDTMVGGVGDDIYFIGSIGDSVVESADEGIDRVRSTISYVLGSHFETLYLDNVTPLNGQGNSANNFLLGNFARNTLNAAEGNDTIFGAKGNDSLIGGTGRDFLNGTNNGVSFGIGERDTLIGGSGADRFGLGISGKVLYDDRVNGNSGNGDYAFIQDFDHTQGDALQLSGAAAQYFLAKSPLIGVVDRGPYYDSNADGNLQINSDELVAIFDNAQNLTTANTIGTARFV